MMTPKERLLAVLEGQGADRPPCICPGGMMNMVTAELMELIGVYLPEAHTDAGKMAALAKAVYETGCFENAGVPFCMTVEAEEMGAGVDLGSAYYEPHVVKYVLETVADWEQLPSIRCETGRGRVVLDAIRLLKKELTDVPVVGNLTGPVSTAGSLIEPVVFYKELRKKRTEAHAYMDFVTKQLIAFGRAQLEAGADVIAISDPSGTGEILGPKYFEEFAVTYLNQLLDGLAAGTDGAEKGGRTACQRKPATIVHICGQMRPVYDQIKKVHSDVLSFDSVVPMKEAKEKLPGRVLMGNVSTYALEFGDKEKVKQLTGNCIKNGSDIISPACGLGMKSPLFNVQAILECVKEQAEGWQR